PPDGGMVSGVQVPHRPFPLGVMLPAGPLPRRRRPPGVPVAAMDSALVVPPEHDRDSQAVQQRGQDDRPEAAEEVVVRRRPGRVEAARADRPPPADLPVPDDERGQPGDRGRDGRDPAEPTRPSHGPYAVAYRYGTPSVAV